MNVQNQTMLLHWRAYGGNFLFGQGVMVTDHPTTDAAIRCPAHRGNNFMGVNIVSSDSNVFATNAGILGQCPPVRTATRERLDATVFTPERLAFDHVAIRARSAIILDEWSKEPDMANGIAIRSVVTRIFLMLLSDVTIPAAVSRDVTFQYIRRFVESSLFNRYFPLMLELLGTHKFVRKDAYFKLKAHGIDPLVIDITLFAAMFSVGTLVLRCIEDVARTGIDYASLDVGRKRHYIIEAVRLNPTVTTVHRMVETDEQVKVCGRPVELTAGDEVVYPFVCSNRDPAAFKEPERHDVNRTDAEYDKVLSWAKGPHACPAKDMSIEVTMVMLDALAARYDLKTLKIFNPAF